MGEARAGGEGLSSLRIRLYLHLCGVAFRWILKLDVNSKDWSESSRQETTFDLQGVKISSEPKFMCKLSISERKKRRGRTEPIRKSATGQ